MDVICSIFVLIFTPKKFIVNYHRSFNSYFDVLLTVHLSVYISVFNLLAPELFF